MLLAFLDLGSFADLPDFFGSFADLPDFFGSFADLPDLVSGGS